MKRGDLSVGVSRRAFLAAGAGFGLFNVVPSSVLSAVSGSSLPQDANATAESIITVTDARITIDKKTVSSISSAS